MEKLLQIKLKIKIKHLLEKKKIKLNIKCKNVGRNVKFIIS